MYGLAILDGNTSKLVLARDRFGIKPLYLMAGASVTAIASEIKQFKFVPGLKLHPNTDALYSYLLTGYEDEEKTFSQTYIPWLPEAGWKCRCQRARFAGRNSTGFQKNRKSPSTIVQRQASLSATN